MKKKHLFLFFPLFILTFYGCGNPEKSTSEEAESEQVEAVSEKPAGCLDILKEQNLFKEDMNARDLNDAGYKLYKQKLYKEAIVIFRCALEKDKDHLYANYNLACTLSLLIKEGYEINIAEIFWYLEKSLEIDPALVAQVKTDEDLNNIKDEPRFSELVERIYKQYMIQKIYPEGEMKVYDQFVGDDNIQILINIRLKEYDRIVYIDNKKKQEHFVSDPVEYGFIPLNRAHILDLGENLSAIAYEIYLCERDLIDTVIGSEPLLPFGNSEYDVKQLIHLAYFNPADFQIYSPEDFYPFFGGWNHITSRISFLEKIKNSDNGCRIEWSDFGGGQSFTETIVFYYLEKYDIIFSSEIIEVNYESLGADIVHWYEDFRWENDRIIATYVTSNQGDMEEDGLKPGEKKEEDVLIILPGL